jgi:hypothetical protein
MNRAITPTEVCDLHFHATLTKSIDCVANRVANKAVADLRARLGVAGRLAAGLSR